MYYAFILIALVEVAVKASSSLHCKSLDDTTQCCPSDNRLCIQRTTNNNKKECCIFGLDASGCIPTTDCPEQNCKGSWSKVDSCSVTCGTGVEKWKFTHKKIAKFGGRDCNVADGTVETRSCDEGPCQRCEDVNPWCKTVEVDKGGCNASVKGTEPTTVTDRCPCTCTCRLDTGIDRNGVCCDAEQCGGVCGGQGCKHKKGGLDKCCTGHILKNGPICSSPTQTGCVLPETADEGSMELMENARLRKANTALLEAVSNLGLN